MNCSCGQSAILIGGGVGTDADPKDAQPFVIVSEPDGSNGWTVRQEYLPEGPGANSIARCICMALPTGPALSVPSQPAPPAVRSPRAQKRP